MSTVLSLKNVNFSYPQRLAPFWAKDKQKRTPPLVLNGVNLELEGDQRIGIVGSNGSGKTTLLKIIAGIYLPTSGHVERNIPAIPLLSGGRGLYQNSSVLENIKIHFLMRGEAGSLASYQDYVLECSGLHKFTSYHVRELSTGMQGRLSFGLATYGSKGILLLDEWIGTGDAEYQEKFRKRMEELTNAAQLFILTSHNEHLINSVCTTKLRMSHGVLEREF